MAERHTVLRTLGLRSQTLIAYLHKMQLTSHSKSTPESAASKMEFSISPDQYE